MNRKISDLLTLFCACLVLPLTAVSAEPGDAFTLYKEANYKAAIPLLKNAIAADTKNAKLHAELLSSLTYEGLVDEASDEADADETAFPESPDVLAARGEFAFYMADMGAAEKLFRAAAKLKPDQARAVFGLARLYSMASFRRSARMLFLKAHELDPDDARITQYWLAYAPEDKRNELQGAFAAAHPWLFRNFEMLTDTRKQLKEALEKRKEFELEGAPADADLHLLTLLNGPRRFVGFGLAMSINGGRKVTLLLDTGASGILLSQSAIDKYGLNHLGTIEGAGIGDDGVKQGFLSVAETCEVGPIKFKNCVLHALNGKRVLSPDMDGLIGIDVFDQYLIHIDFQRRVMNLKPFPTRPENPQGYDREVPPSEKDFTPVFRSGGHLFVTTQMNGQDSGLFLLDTGAGLTSVDSTFAELSVKLHRDDTVRMRGISGEVKKVFEADKAEILFSHFRQHNLGMTVFDLNNTPGHHEFRMSGIMGIPLLALFNLTIDYRNGLVHFEQAVH